MSMSMYILDPKEVVTASYFSNNTASYLNKV